MQLHFQWLFKSIIHTVTIEAAVTDEKCAACRQKVCVCVCAPACVFVSCMCVCHTVFMQKCVQSQIIFIVDYNQLQKENASALCLALMNEGNCCHQSGLTLWDRRL